MIGEVFRAADRCVPMNALLLAEEPPFPPTETLRRSTPAENEE